MGSFLTCQDVLEVTEGFSPLACLYIRTTEAAHILHFNTLECYHQCTAVSAANIYCSSSHFFHWSIIKNPIMLRNKPAYSGKLYYKWIFFNKALTQLYQFKSSLQSSKIISQFENLENQEGFVKSSCISLSSECGGKARD